MLLSQDDMSVLGRWRGDWSFKGIKFFMPETDLLIEPEELEDHTEFGRSTTSVLELCHALVGDVDTGSCGHGSDAWYWPVVMLLMVISEWSWSRIR